jgi:hypothetical protein
MCYNLTSMYLPINLITMDSISANLYIVAGEELEILISSEGEVTIL